MPNAETTTSHPEHLKEIKLVQFRFSGKLGHFLRAESNASALSYPIPPRTVLLGLAGAVLGLGKDEPQKKLEPAAIALRGHVPISHWHRVKLRKDPPERLPRTVKRTQKPRETTRPEKAALITQEWLWKPEYQIWMGLPEAFHANFEDRLRDRRWHFPPCLGLSELSADLVFENSVVAEPLPEGQYEIDTVVPRQRVGLQMNEVYERGLVIHALQMPYQVTAARVFSHRAYFLEKEGNKIPLKTGCAYKAGSEYLLFL